MLLLLARAEADGGEFDPSAAANELGIAESDVRSSLKFWRGAGVLGRALRKKAISAEAAGAPPESAAAADTANTRALPERRAAKYTSEELCRIASADEGFRVLIDMAQQTAGHIFNTPEIEIIAGLYSHLGLSAEYILTLLNYYVKRKGKTRAMPKRRVFFRRRGRGHAGRAGRKAETA